MDEKSKTTDWTSSGERPRQGSFRQAKPLSGQRGASLRRFVN
jgi:hypothetical protein